MIFIRDDDVLLKRKAHKDAEAEFWNVHNIIEKYGYMHCPAILCRDLEEFPETIKLIKKKTAEGYMRPELHGSSHIDYAKLSHDELIVDYAYCQQWFMRNLETTFTKHFTPWGAGGRRKDGTPMINGRLIAPTAASLGIVIKDMYKPIDPRHIIADKDLHADELVRKYSSKTLFIHWWYSPEFLDEALGIMKKAER